jgi:hypothetical protein
MNQPDPPSLTHATSDHEAVALSNGIRLTVREWVGLGIFSLVLLLAAPRVWEQAEPFEAEPDYRIPYELSNDYWLYDRYARAAASRYEVLVLGDSVVWGPYVTRRQTLSHCLNEIGAADHRFANLGLNGAHPAALAGLIEYYARGVSGKMVLLQCNPLWLTSPVQDLQEEGQRPFEHPDLVPQFFPKVPRYKAEASKRIGAVISRHIAFTAWTRHLQDAYFGQSDIPNWTLEHPYENPVRQFDRDLPPPDDRPLREPVPWHAHGGKLDAAPWIDLDQSLQWASFQRAVQILQDRGNRLFVLVGPYNEHMLTALSRERYQVVKGTIENWLQKRQVVYFAPPVLPRDEYGDVSHPLAAGYHRLAQYLCGHGFFTE